MPEEGFQIWIGRVNGSIVDLVGESYIAVEIEIPPIVIRVLEHHVFEMIDRNRERLRAG